MDPNKLDENLVLIIALVHFEMNMFRSATGENSSSSVQGCSRVVNMNHLLAVGKSTTMRILNLNIRKLLVVRFISRQLYPRQNILPHSCRSGRIGLSYSHCHWCKLTPISLHKAHSLEKITIQLLWPNRNS